MEDKDIVDLYLLRNEEGISASAQKYGAYCHRIAYNILENPEDSEECVNDTWVQTWKAIPPQRPVRLAPFLGKITRNLAINRMNARNAQKRGGGAYAVALEELDECIASISDTEGDFSRKELADAINRFLHMLPARDCDIFLNRYFYVEKIPNIAARYGIKEQNVLLILSRTRKKLKEYLVKEGYTV